MKAPDDGQPPGTSPPMPRDSTPHPGRGQRLRVAVRHTAIGSAQLILIAAGLTLVGFVLSRLWSVLLPVILGLLVTTVLWPVARFLRAHRWPPAAAAGVTVVAFLALLGGVILLIVPPVVDQSGELADQAGQGLERLQSWVTGPPFNLGEEQIGEALDNVTSSLQDNAQQIAGSALGWASSVGSGVINAVLALVLTFFFLKDGPRWLPWLSEQTGRRAGRHVAQVSEQSWQTLSGFIRQQALVGFIDAFFIGLGLWITGVPLVLPLAVLTFFGAFIPIIGAFVAGGFAVLIALVSEGPTTALIVLGIVVLVQQVEGNVLQPIIQGRGLNLHPAVVILAVTAGSSLAGIIGAFLAVPVAAVVAVVYRYARDQINRRESEPAEDRNPVGGEAGRPAGPSDLAGA
jgi:predicted PurR-regulated permease PerM